MLLLGFLGLHRLFLEHVDRLLLYLFEEIAPITAGDDEVVRFQL